MKFSYFVCELTKYILQLVARENFVSYIIAVAAPSKKSMKITLSIAVYTGGLAKNHFWLVSTRKKRIRDQPNYFLNMCPKPFSWAKNQGKLFLDGKSRGPLLARVALNQLWGLPAMCQIASVDFILLRCQLVKDRYLK